MTMGKELMKPEVGLSRPPDKVISEAKIAVNVFKGVIELKPKKVIINGEQYLEYEDWQMLGEFYRCSAITKDAVPIEINGVKGAKARADLVNIDTGEIIGGAEAYCMRDEERWSTRPVYEYQEGKRIKVGDEPVPWFQLASMAQTRAGAKAFRNRLAWVAVMAGYRPTPAEEMTGHEVSRDETGHFCKLHNTPFFMKGKMKAFAHPIGNTGEWCYEHKEEPPDKRGEFAKDGRDLAKEVAEKVTAPKPEDTKQTPPEVIVKTESEQPPQSIIDIDEFRIRLNILEKKGIKAWTRAITLKRINAMAGGDAKGIPEALASLDKEKSDILWQDINDAVKMSGG